MELEQNRARVAKTCLDPKKPYCAQHKVVLSPGMEASGALALRIAVEEAEIALSNALMN
jgi:hypothetical protein